MSHVVQRLQQSVNTRHDELGKLVDRLPASAGTLQRRSAVARVVVIAAITALEAYFKWEGRASELRSLAESARSTLRTVDSQWQLGVGAAESEQERITTLKNIIDLLDRELHRIREACASLNASVDDEDDESPRQLYPA